MQILTDLCVYVRRLAMRTHDASPGCDALIEQLLHQLSLIDPVRQTHAITLPIRPGPFWLVRKLQAFNVAEQFGIPGGDRPAASYQLGQPFKLFAPDSGLDVSHPIVKAHDE